MAGRSDLFAPNNLLGMEYIKAAELLHSRMEPVAIRRAGMGYHERGAGGDGFLSATAIRENMSDGDFSGSLGFCGLALSLGGGLGGSGLDPLCGMDRLNNAPVLGLLGMLLHGYRRGRAGFLPNTPPRMGVFRIRNRFGWRVRTRSAVIGTNWNGLRTFRRKSPAGSGRICTSRYRLRILWRGARRSTLR